MQKKVGKWSNSQINEAIKLLNDAIDLQIQINDQVDKRLRRIEFKTARM